MSRPFALQTVLELMQRRADEATLQLARLIATEQDAATKLKLLADYREEYAQRFQAAAQDGLTPQQWRNFQDFLARLDDAITQQHQAVIHSQRNTAAGQANWQSQQVRLKAIDTLSARHVRSETIRSERQEQKLVDEFAARNRQVRADEN